MTQTEQAQLLEAVVQQYLGSGDFNGLPIHTLTSAGRHLNDLRYLVRELLRQDRVDVVFGRRHPNPHVKAIGPRSRQEQIQDLDGPNFEQACLYPAPEELAQAVDQSHYERRPYGLALALGAPQLEPVYFDPLVLRRYVDDPRYRFQPDEIGGQISVTQEAYEAGVLQKRDEVFLKAFGFGYDADLTRVVVGFPCDLSDLSPEHQEHWRGFELSGEFYMHPEYAARTAGFWEPSKLSLFEALLLELQVINDMAKAMGRPPLFRQDFRDRERPREFTFLLAPTLKEYLLFVQTLDKVLSDNLNKKFFRGLVPLEEHAEQTDDTVLKIQKGTLRLLEEWVRDSFRPADGEPLNELFATLKKVRDERSPAAHRMDEDAWDQALLRKQRELIQETYGAVRLLRLALANHPRVKDVVVPEQLFKGEIWSY